MNEAKRISERCTEAGTRKEKLRHFDLTLEANGYPKNFRGNRARRRGKMNEKPKICVFFHFPFFNDAIKKRVNGIFRTAGLPVRTFSKSVTLRSVLNRKKKEERRCNLKDCKVNDPSLCYRKNCVYKCVCDNCGKMYIGSTARFLHTRINEHYKNSNSSIFHTERIARPPSPSV